MIEAANTGDLQQTVKYENGVKKVLRWKKNERMGGMVPVWEKAPETAKTQVENKLAQAATGKTENRFEAALAYANSSRGATSYEPQEFGFGDLIDMVNPLQHVPLVGHVYRELTGDDIRPIAQIVGGGVYGGPLGAAGGLINTVIEYETGRDITGNIVAMVAEGQTLGYRGIKVADNPEENLNETVKSLEENPDNLPGSVIGFVDLGHGRHEVYEAIPAADGRTAGTMIRKQTQALPSETAREPITQLVMNPMPLPGRGRDMAEN